MAARRCGRQDWERDACDAERREHVVVEQIWADCQPDAWDLRARMLARNFSPTLVMRLPNDVLRHLIFLGRSHVVMHGRSMLAFRKRMRLCCLHRVEQHRLESLQQSSIFPVATVAAAQARFQC